MIEALKVVCLEIERRKKEVGGANTKGKELFFWHHGYVDNVDWDDGFMNIYTCSNLSNYPL